MRIVVIAVGTPKQPGLAAAIREYESRIARYFNFETVEVRPRNPPSGDTASIMEAESTTLLDRVPDGLEVIALDRRGVTWTSEELARYVQNLAVYAKPGAAFLIGGPSGLSESLRSRAARVLSLSSFTLPHELARLVLAEQLYRACTILRGEPYHKGG